MHSIQTRITALTVMAVLITILAFGGAAIYSAKLVSDRSSVEKMNLICEDRKKTMDEYLNSVRQSIETVARYAGETLDSAALVEGGIEAAPGDRTPEQQEALDRYLAAHIADVEQVFRSVANHTNGINAFYYFVDPKVSGSVKGFLYDREETDDFRALEMPDLTAYPINDMANTGWYYLSVMRGRPSWLEPYDNAVGSKVVSYTAPIYKAGACVGVVGMDIKYDTLVEQIADLTVYDTGFAWLADRDGTILYHPVYEAGRTIAEIEPQLTGAAALLKQESSGDEMIRYHHSSGQERQLSFTTLSNGMKLFVVAPVSEINTIWVRLISIFVLVGAVLMAVFTVVMLLATRRITRPLLRLTVASKRLAAGDYDVELDYPGDDEVGVLTNSFQQMRDRLKTLIADLSNRANTDALTGVRNKSAFDLFAARLNEQIARAGTDDPPAFAVIMFDCNSLKEINDQYGHDKGDIYLRTVCGFICRVFAHSPVFRLGGDEFAVILQNADFENRETLLAGFDRAAGALNASVSDPWNRVDAAKGIARFHPGEDTRVEQVLSRADKRMYAEKKKTREQALPS